jgi:hypothetical protein
LVKRRKNIGKQEVLFSNHAFSLWVSYNTVEIDTISIQQCVS